MAQFKSGSKSRFKLVGSDKQKKSDKRNSTDDDALKTLHFPERTPWGDRKDDPEAPADILDSIERQIDRAQDALGQLDENTDVLFRITDDDNDNDTPTAA